MVCFKARFCGRAFLIMGKAKDVSPRKISEIKTLLLNTNHSQRRIAIIANVAKSSVDKIKKKSPKTKVSPQSELESVEGKESQHPEMSGK